METQKTSNSQNKFEKEKWSWRNQSSWLQFSSVKFSYSVVFDSLRFHGLEHNRLLCPSPTLEVCSNSCLLSWWCRPTISCSVVLFFSCLQSFPASGKFPNHIFASFSISPSNEYSALISSRIDWLDLLAVQGALKSFLQHNSSKASIFQC